MAQLPAPLLADDVSMGGNPWFPLYHRRLLKSRWWRIASDTARSRNVDLWCHAFDEMPAGSLPNDDLELAEFAGFGRDVTAFEALKVEIMAPWTLCSDDRWYHPALCEVVLECWERTGEKRRADRARQAAHRKRMKEQTQHAHDGASPLVTRDDGGVSRVTEAEVTRIDATQTDRKDRIQETDATAAPLASVDGGKFNKAPKVEPWKDDADFLKVWDGATNLMRRRCRSMRKAWAEWVKLRKSYEAARILTGLRGYLKGDPDVARTGGPGLHIWLKDETFEMWAAEAPNPATDWSPERWAIALTLWKEHGRWHEDNGPPPGEAGCRVPQAALTQAGLGLPLVGGGSMIAPLPAQILRLLPSRREAQP